MMDFSTNFHNARQDMIIAKKRYKEVCSTICEALKSYLEDKPNGATAAEMAKITGLHSRDIANIMNNYAYSNTTVARSYILVDENGEPDFSHKMTRHYRVRLYKAPTRKY